MMEDTIDRLIQQWAEERPDLDATPMGIAGRVLRLAMLLQGRVEEALDPFDLTLWQFDVLATLRRFGAPYRMSPKELMAEVMLSSGAMTNRIDRMEAKGLVRRLPDPRDRRGVLIEMTEEGLRVIDEAIAARFEEAREVVEMLERDERAAVEDALRRLILGIENGSD